MKTLLLCCTVAAFALGMTSCEHTNMTGTYLFKPASIAIPARDIIANGYWDKPKDLEGHHTIVVDTEKQEARYYINGRQVGSSAVSSGKAGHDTPKGEFSVIDKDINHRSSTYGSIVDSRGNVMISDYTVGAPIPKGGKYKGAEMNYGMQLTRSGIWMHEGAVTQATESHGCIRLPRNMAKIFFENTPVGSTVIIK